MSVWEKDLTLHSTDQHKLNFGRKSIDCTIFCCEFNKFEHVWKWKIIEIWHFSRTKQIQSNNFVAIVHSIIHVQLNLFETELKLIWNWFEIDLNSNKSKTFLFSSFQNNSMLSSSNFPNQSKKSLQIDTTDIPTINMTQNANIMRHHKIEVFLEECQGKTCEHERHCKQWLYSTSTVKISNAIQYQSNTSIQHTHKTYKG